MVILQAALSEPAEKVLSPEEIARSWTCLAAKADAVELRAGTTCELAIVTETGCEQGALSWKGCTLSADAKLEVTLKSGENTEETLSLRAPKSCGSGFTLDGLEVKRTDGPAAYAGSIATMSGGSRQVVKVDAAKLTQAQTDAILAAGRKWVEIEEGKDAWCEADIRKAEPRPGSPPTLDAALADVPKYCFMKAPTSEKPPKSRRTVRRLKRETVCLWTDGERVETVLRPKRLLPGQPTRVVVIGPGASSVSVRQEGAIGYELAIDDRTGTTIEAARLADDAETPPGPSQIKYFEGRGPGAASLILKKGDKELPPVEIYYPNTYMGSIRFGFGIVGGPAVGREYASVKKAGSSTYEVVESATGRLAWELVLAYSVYPEAFLGGRDYGSRLFSRNNWGVGPTVGVGVVSVADGKVDVFKSLYLGLEFEPVRYFSIGAGPVLRRTDRLAEGYQVGSALVDDKVPTRTSVDVGWFVLITVSPQFMKTAFRGKE
ncbi:MAG: hypothetical protein R3B09_24195 [Nannocystaceae bacterium]